MVLSYQFYALLGLFALSVRGLWKQGQGPPNRPALESALSPAS